MFLSALSLAALLQGMPTTGQQDLLLQRHALEVGQPVDQLRAPFPKRHRTAPEESRPAALTSVNKPEFGAKPLKRPPPTFARIPMYSACHSRTQPVGRPEALPAQPLSKLPKAHGEWAVARLVDGCPVPVLIAQAAPAR